MVTLPQFTQGFLYDTAMVRPKRSKQLDGKTDITWDEILMAFGKEEGTLMVWEEYNGMEYCAV